MFAYIALEDERAKALYTWDVYAQHEKKTHIDIR